jgi:hypothetical protein
MRISVLSYGLKYLTNFFLMLAVLSADIFVTVFNPRVELFWLKSEVFLFKNTYLLFYNGILQQIPTFGSDMYIKKQENNYKY